MIFFWDARKIIVSSRYLTACAKLFYILQRKPFHLTTAQIIIIIAVDTAYLSFHLSPDFSTSTLDRVCVINNYSTYPKYVIALN